MAKRARQMQVLAVDLASQTVTRDDVVFRRGCYEVPVATWDEFWKEWPDASLAEEERFAETFIRSLESALKRRGNRITSEFT